VLVTAPDGREHLHGHFAVLAADSVDGAGATQRESGHVKQSPGAVVIAGQRKERVAALARGLPVAGEQVIDEIERERIVSGGDWRVGCKDRGGTDFAQGGGKALAALCHLADALEVPCIIRNRKVHQVMALRHRAFAFDPDLVVLQVFTQNDVRDNSRLLSKEPLRPYFTLEQGKLVLDDSFATSAEYRAKESSGVLYRMIDHVRLLQLLNLVKNNVRKRWLLEQRDGSGLAAPAGKIEHPIYAEPKSEPWREAWRVTDALIAEMAHEVAARKRRLVVMSTSNPIQGHPDRGLRRHLRGRRAQPRHPQLLEAPLSRPALR